MRNVEQNFNSIKVQLKQLQFVRRANFALFQFHKGTIKTPVTLLSPRSKAAISIP